MTTELFTIESGLGGLPRVTITAPDGGSLQVYLHGATITSWVPPRSAEQLYLSKTSFFEADKPIRGGVPVCFPQFAARGPLSMMHGFARQLPWMFAGATPTPQGGAAARLVQMANAASHAIWDFDYSLSLDITLTARQLSIALSVTNPGARTFQFGGALHTYFAVEEISGVVVEGLQGCAYTDHLTGETPRIQEEAMITFDGLVNRLYGGAPHRAFIREGNHRVEVRKEGFPDAVVWNAGEERGATIVDLEPGGYQKYVCVEATLAQQINLPPAQTWRGVQHITLL